VGGSIPVPRFPGIPSFSLDPRQFGGRRAAIGFAFQKNYITYVLAGLAAGEKDFVFARIEGVEDLDILTRTEKGWIESYYQIKSRKEGTGNWTIARIENEGVLSHFYKIYREFLAASPQDSRQIELILAVEGDLDPEVSGLKHKTQGVSKARAKAFATASLHELTTTEQQYQDVAIDVRRFYETIAVKFLRPSPPKRKNIAELKTYAAELSKHFCQNSQVVEDDIFRAATEARGTFDGFCACLRFESRLSHLKESALSHLQSTGDFGPEGARLALERLTKAVENESSRPDPTIIDPTVLADWLGIQAGPILQSKPVGASGWVERKDLLSQIAGLLTKHRFVVLYGLTKIGKSQLVSSLVDFLKKRNDYFWFSFSGSPTDSALLVEQLAFWAGKRMSVRQVYEDVAAHRLSLAQAFERLSNLQMDGVLVILDDSHKQKDKSVFEKVGQLVADRWSNSQLIVISEQRIPETSIIGSEHFHVSGLEPKEAIQFVRKRGIDLSLAVVEFCMLSVQIGGHPLMLRAIAERLSKRPSRDDILTIQKDLPKIGSVRAFREVLSQRVFFDLLKSDSQRTWMRKLSALTSSFTPETAFVVAQTPPKLSVGQEDWNCLASSILEEIRANHYSLPALIREISVGRQDKNRNREIQIAAARHFFKSAITSGKADFQDFHAAIVHLIVAGEHEEAAFRFLAAFPSFLKARAFEPFEFLFMVLNGDPVQRKLHEPEIRISLLGAELTLRLGAKGSLDHAKVLGLIRRTHTVVRKLPRGKMRSARQAVLLTTLSFARGKRLGDFSEATAHQLHRLFTPIQLAIELVISGGERKEILRATQMYVQSSSFAYKLTPSVLRQAILATKAVKGSPMTVEAVNSLYRKYAFGTTDTSHALAVLDQHSAEYQEKGLVGAHFTCEHVAALLIHGRLGEYGKARERIRSLYVQGDEIGLSPELLARAELLIADTYWAEKDYSQSAEFYRKALGRQFDDVSITRHARGRLLDSLIMLAKYHEAVSLSLNFLRNSRRHMPARDKLQIYARIAYACAEKGNIKQAAIACWRLCRLAEISGDDELKYLAHFVSAWVLQHLEFSDALIFRPQMTIRDSDALSDSVSPKALEEWRKADPLRIKTTCLIAATFELIGELRRSENLLMRALKVSEKAESQNSEAPPGSIFLCAKLGRIQINCGRMTEAAGSVMKAINLSLQSSGIKASIVTWQLWELIKPGVRWPADEDVSLFFSSLAAGFKTDFAVQAWVRYLECGILFDRLVIQKAKRRLLEAEQFAESASDKHLLASIRNEKLFVRIESMFSSQTDWLTEALKTANYLATEAELQEAKGAFGQNVDTVARHYSGPIFREILQTLQDLKQHYSDHQFEVAVYALWKEGSRAHLLSGSLPKIEAYLRENAKYLPI